MDAAKAQYLADSFKAVLSPKAPAQSRFYSPSLAQTFYKPQSPVAMLQIPQKKPSSPQAKFHRHPSLPSISPSVSESLPVLFANNKGLFLDKPDPKVGHDHWRLRMDATQRLSHSPVCLYDIQMRDQEQQDAEELQPIASKPHKPNTSSGQKNIPEEEFLEDETPAFSRLVDWKQACITWAPCIVIGKVIPGLYVIKWTHNQKNKIVDRFNLRFPQEMEPTVAKELDNRLQLAVDLRYQDIYQANLKSKLT